MHKNMCIYLIKNEEFQDTKVVIGIRKSKKDNI